MLKNPEVLNTPEGQILWARARKLATFAFALPVTYVCCPSTAANSLEDWLDPSRFNHPQREVQFHGTYRWCPECMDGCRCLDFVEVLGTEEQGHDEDMSCVWCRSNGRAPYEARLAGAMIGEGVDL